MAREGKRSRWEAPDFIQQKNRAVQTQRTPEVTCRLPADHVCTSSIFKNHPFSFRKTLRVFACKNACASSLTTSLNIFLRENQQFSFRNYVRVSTRDTAAHLLSKRTAHR